MPTRWRESPLVELGYVALGFAGYLLVRWYTLDRTDEAVANAREVLAVERATGLDVEHTVQSTASESAPWLVDAANHVYVWGYLPVLVAAAVWLYLRHRDAYGTLRTALLASGAVGLLVYALYPCAPPWITDDRFSDTVSSASLEAFARPAGIMNELGAMPSFHCAWLTLGAVVVFRATGSRMLRAVCVALPLAMFVAVVVTGNHWVLDIPAGLALTALGLVVALRMPVARPPSARHPAAVAGAG